MLFRICFGSTNAATVAVLPFDDPDWVFELKYDGFRALAVIEHGGVQLISRNGNQFASFSDLAKNIGACISNTELTVLDGRDRVPGQQGQATISGLAVPPGRSMLLCVRRA